MRIYLSLLALAALVPLTSLPAQADATAPPALYAPTAQDTSLLWRIDPGNGAAPSYLFGTIHLIPEDDFFLDESVVSALNSVDAVHFEIDPREMQNPAAMMGLMGKISMRNDTTLEDLLRPSQYDSIANYFTDNGLPFFMLRNMKPMFLSAMVGQDLTMGNPFGGDQTGGGMKSYEMELNNMAREADKQVGGLETMEFQLSLFDSIPYSVQAEMLYQTVVDDLNPAGEGDGGQLEQMVAMYRRRAVAEMSQLITSESAGYGNFEELLVVRRNQNWVPQILDQLGATPALYAVGAGHLGGEYGVIALLRAQGISIEPVFE